MRDRASGIDDRPVVTDAEERSISAEETFARDIQDAAQLQAELTALADRVSSRLRARKLTAGVVDIKVRRHNFETFSRQKSLGTRTHDNALIVKVARDLLQRWLAEHPGARVRLLGVGVADLATGEQMDLFAAPPAKLDATVDSIRARFGKAALSRGLRGLPRS
jgi:DNA polymerase-4